jgi:phospholipid/cholesterol/gamma-HCH transport system substrate-binding protein
MAKKISTVKVGLFIFVGIAILVIGIFLIGRKQALFSSTFSVKAYFQDIQGLRNGATVRLSGIDVGAVNDVEIVNDTTGRVEVTMNLKEDIHNFIRTDTRASIETEGLVGNKVVVITVGSASAEEVKDGGIIKSKEPMSISAIIEETQGVMRYTKDMTKDLSEIVSRVNKGEGSIGKLLVDNELYNNAARLTESADTSLKSITKQVNQLTSVFKELGSGIKSVIGNVDNVVVDLDTIITGVKKGKGVMGAMLVDKTRYDTVFSKTINNIEKMTAEAKLAASRLAENMEALKHNWLFKSYFEERGYWDKDKYEDEIDSKMQELDIKIKLIDQKIEALKSLQTRR